MSLLILFSSGEAATELVVQDSSFALAIENVALVQQNTLVVQDSAFGLANEAVALTQQHTLAVQDSAFGLTADNVALTQANTLAVQDSAFSLAVEGVALTQASTLAVADSAFALSADTVSLTQQNVLAVQDSAIAVGIESPVLVQQNTLAVEDSAFASTAENVALVQQNTSVPTEPPTPGAGMLPSRPIGAVWPWVAPLMRATVHSTLPAVEMRTRARPSLRATGRGALRPAQGSARAGFEPYRFAQEVVRGTVRGRITAPTFAGTGLLAIQARARGELPELEMRAVAGTDFGDDDLIALLSQPRWRRRDSLLLMLVDS